MRRSCPILLAILLAVPTTLHANPPTLRLSWDDCGPLGVSKDFAGPASYSQTIYVEGLQQPLSSFSFTIGMGVGAPDAWQFYSDGFPGCQGIGRVAVTAAAGGCSSIPGVTYDLHMFPGLTDPHVYLWVNAHVTPSFTPDPGARYALAHLVYDHTHSVAGPSGAGTCGEADQLACFGIVGTTINSGSFPGTDFVWTNDMITWQQPGHSGICPYAVPANPTTWGRIKVLYR